MSMTDKPKLAIPTVHNNGTSKQALLDQLGEAILAVHAAGRKLAAACPHGRDYYVQGDGVIHTAMRQHEARLAALKSVTDELQIIAEAVVDQ